MLFRSLVETETDGRVRRFLEKPNPDEITCNTINAGIYVLEPETFDRIPRDVSYSIERAYFPSLVERGETFVAYAYRGYWLDIGTPASYRQVHRDIMDGNYRAVPFSNGPAVAWVAPCRLSRTSWSSCGSSPHALSCATTACCLATLVCRYVTYCSSITASRKALRTIAIS